jgi:hypothetical protein
MYLQNVQIKILKKLLFFTITDETIRIRIRKSEVRIRIPDPY